MIRNFTFITGCLLLFVNLQLLAYNTLYINNPHGWESGQGTIEKAEIHMKPVGIYMQYDLFLTISGKGLSNFNADTQYEIVLNFELDPQAIVYDSWLYIGNYVSKGIIMDRWKASMIYEEIVDRRKDPSILTKLNKTQYELRIYPMLGNESRKIKLSYMIPMQWNSLIVTAPLPTNIIKTSRQIPSIKLKVWKGQEWQSPQLIEHPEISIDKNQDINADGYISTEISAAIASNVLTLGYDSPMTNGIYLSKYENNENAYYQMAFIPGELMEIDAPRKVLFLVDYEMNSSYLSAEDIKNTLKTALLTNLNKKDKFNIMLSGFSINAINNSWTTATKTNIDNCIDSFDADAIAGYSNLPGLLQKGIDYINQNGKDASIVLISSSSQFSDYEVANNFINDIIDMMEYNIPVYIADVYTQNDVWTYIGNSYFKGNQYLYQNLARLTGGEALELNSGIPIEHILSELLMKAGENINSFDLHTSLDDGFCFGRYNLGNELNSVSANSVIMQVGQYYGNLPFEIQVSGIFRDIPFSHTYSLPEMTIYESDSLLVKMWAGNYIHELEGQDYSNDVISEIVNYSLNFNVLSLYTAFLCLEENMEAEDFVDDENFKNPDTDNGWEDNWTSIEKPKQEEITFNAYPNPFNFETTIKLNIPEGVDNKNISISIYDLLGRKVKTFANEQIIGNEVELKWNGTGNNDEFLENGIYILIIQTPEEKYTLKLILQK